MVVVVGWGTSLPHGPRPHVSRYFWIGNFFFPDSKISTSTRIRIQIKFARPLVSRTRIQIHSSIQDSSGNIGNRASVVKRAKFTSCSALRECHLEYSIHGKELDSILLRHRIKKYPDLASTRFRIQSVFKNFHSGEQIQKVADSYAGFTGYVWTEPASGKKKLRIRKYPDTCGRGIGILKHFQAFFPVELSDFLAPVKSPETVEGDSFQHLDLVLF